MPSWTTIMIICGLFSALGVASDRLTLRRHRSAFHDTLYRWWFRIDDALLPDLPKLMASWTLYAISSFIGRRIWSFRSIGVFSIVSVLLTWFALDLWWTTLANDVTYGDPDDIKTFLGNLIHAPFRPEFYIIALINIPLDIATMLVTLRMLGVIRERKVFLGIGAAATDLFLAYVFNAIFFAGFLSFASANIKVFLSALVVFWPAFVVDSFMWVITGDANMLDEMLLTGLLSATVFVPTFLYMGFLFLISLCKLIIQGTKGVALYIIEVMLDDPNPEKTPVFTLSATLLSTIAVFVKTIQHFLAPT